MALGQFDAAFMYEFISKFMTKPDIVVRLDVMLCGDQSLSGIFTFETPCF